MIAEETDQSRNDPDDIGAKILLGVCSTTTTTDGQASMEIGGCRQPEFNDLDDTNDTTTANQPTEIADARSDNLFHQIPNATCVPKSKDNVPLSMGIQPHTHQAQVIPYDFQSPVVFDEIPNNNEAKAKLGVINVMPDLKWYTTINFIQNTQKFDIVEDIAKICGHLLNEFKAIQSKLPNKSVYDRYQIVLHPIRKHSTLCQLFLRVSALQWYKYEKKKNKQIEESKDEHIEEKVDYYIEEKADYHIQQVTEQYQNDGFDSDSKPDHSYKVLKTDYECSEKVLVNGKRERCGFYVKKDYCIYKTNEFCAAARFNKCPVITISPRKHCQNEDWFKRIQIFQHRLCDVIPAAWHAVREVLQYIQNELDLNELPLSRIYVNFGEWHSQNRNGRVNGHAHINIVLTRAAIDACKNTSSKLRCLSNSIISPPNYHKSDSEKLAKLRQANKSNLSNNDRVDEQKPSSNGWE